MKARPSWTTILSWLLAIAASVTFGQSYGFNYGTDNQGPYMLGALRLLDPTVLNKDWYALGPSGYHPIFSYIGWLLLLPDRGGWGLGIGLVAVAVLGAIAVYQLLRALFEERIALPAFALLSGLMIVTRTSTVASSYIFSFVLQPSTMSSLFLLAALPPFAEGKWLKSGVYLGLAGLFHANFLVLGFPVFGFAHLLLGAELRGDESLPKRLLRQLGPSLVALAMLAPLILKSTGSAHAERAQEILFTIRSPHHYVPKSYERDFFPFAAWQMIGLGAGAWALRGGKGPRGRVGALVIAMMVLVWSGTLLTTVVNVPRVAQVFVWRYAPFLELLAQAVACATAVRVAVDPSFARRLPRTGIALSLTGMALLAMLDGNRGPVDLAPALLSLLLLPLAAVGLFEAHGALARAGKLERARAIAARIGLPAAIVAAIGCAVWIDTAYLLAHPVHSNLIAGIGADESDLYAWARKSSPKDAIFVTPPGLERFRLRAERAIIADWKGSPITPGDILEWYKRLEDVAGKPNWKGSGELNNGYGALDLQRLGVLKEKYGISYAVVSKSPSSSLDGLEVVFQNSHYKVLKVP